MPKPPWPSTASMRYSCSRVPTGSTCDGPGGSGGAPAGGGWSARQRVRMTVASWSGRTWVGTVRRNGFTVSSDGRSTVASGSSPGRRTVASGSSSGRGRSFIVARSVAAGTPPVHAALQAPRGRGRPIH